MLRNYYILNIERLRLKACISERSYFIAWILEGNEKQDKINLKSNQFSNIVDKRESGS